MDTPYKVALIGLGKMGMQNAKNAQIAKYRKYNSHIEALNDHPDFECDAFYDQNKDAEGRNYDSLQDIAENYRPDILVLATPPEDRIDTIKAFSNLKAVVMEKPVATTYASAKEIVEYCENNNILLQINYWRRFDQSIIDLKANIEKTGETPQAVFMTYGNGLRNNAVHLIDKVRYLFGDIADTTPLSPPRKPKTCPIQGDANLDFTLALANGGRVHAHALDFEEYREIGMDIWMKTQRIEFIQGGLVIRVSERNAHRALQTDREITSDTAKIYPTGAGEALYVLYDNLSQTLQGKEKLRSNGTSALKNEEILDKILT